MMAIHKIDLPHFFHISSMRGFTENNPNYPSKFVFSPLLPSINRTYEEIDSDRIAAEKLACLKARKIIALSYDEAQTIINGYEVPNDSIEVVLSGVDRDIFHPSKFDSNLNNVVFVSCNAIRPQKRQDEAIDLFHKIRPLLASRSNLIFVGNVQDSEYFKKLKRKIINYGFSHYVFEGVNFEKVPSLLKYDVTFLGSVDQTKMGDILRFSDVSILPSKDETFGISLLESLSTGLPTVCYNLPAYRNFLLNTSNPYKVSLKSHLGDSIDWLIDSINDNRKKFIYEANQYLDKYSWKSMADRCIQIYSDL